MVFIACCIAYFFTEFATQENNAEKATPTPIQNNGEPKDDGGGDTGNCGVLTDDIFRLFEDEMLANRCFTHVSITRLGNPSGPSPLPRANTTKPGLPMPLGKLVFDHAGGRGQQKERRPRKSAGAQDVTGRWLP